MVEDPNLAVHLAHWGINMMKMEKSDRSMADLEIELNQKYGEASMNEEANSNLKPVFGPSKFLLIFFSMNPSDKVHIDFRLYGYEKSWKFVLYEFGDASLLYFG